MPTCTPVAYAQELALVQPHVYLRYMQEVCINRNCIHRQHIVRHGLAHLHHTDHATRE